MELAILEGNGQMTDIYNAYSKLAPDERAELLGRSLLRKVGSGIASTARTTQKNVLRPATHLALIGARNPIVKTGLNVAVPGSMTALNTAQSLVRKIAPSSPALAQKIESSIEASPSSWITKMRDLKKAPNTSNWLEKMRAMKSSNAIDQNDLMPPVMARPISTPGINDDSNILEDLMSKVPAVKTETSLNLSNMKTPALIGGGLFIAYLIFKKK